MLFPTFEFAVFFCLVFVLSWLLRPRPLAWRLFILAASYVFYGWWDARFILLLVGSTLVNQTAAVAIHRTEPERSRRVILAAAVVANLGVLAYFKYYGFFLTSVTDGLARVGMSVNPPLLQVILPVGISFFTFQALSYVIDTFRGDAEPAPLLDFAVYLSFFPHLIAGPIVRARELLPQLNDIPDPRRLDAPLALRLIFAGLFKKVVVSSFVAAAIVDPVFANPSLFSSLSTVQAPGPSTTLKSMASKNFMDRSRSATWWPTNASPTTSAGRFAGCATSVGVASARTNVKIAIGKAFFVCSIFLT